MARFLITSALPYINGIKHLGNLTGSMLPADVHARFRRMQGHEVLFVCGTDEHGTPAELAAAEAGLAPRAYCDRQFEIQRSLYEQFDLSFDWFGRSSAPENAALTQELCDVLEQHGLVEARLSDQVYSPADGRFLPDRYVEGRCPRCAYEAARGDQCDNCGALLDPLSLLDPRSKISGSTQLEARPTEHLYLKLSKVEPELRAWVETRTSWPPLARAIAGKWLDEGLKDRPITRDLAWGVPVLKNGAPRPGFENKVFYVWFDAPIAYIASTVEWSRATGQDWRRWWRTDHGADDVTYVQFMGQDNVAFHAISFPATLLGSRQPWKLVDRLKAFSWVNWYGRKFSTSKKRGVFMDHALQMRPADYWRWCLMANAPDNADVAFAWDTFQKAVNSDLANVLGNFVNRVLQFTVTRFGGTVPPLEDLTSLERDVIADLGVRLELLTRLHEQMELRKAAAETRAIWAIGNEYLQTAKPWALMATDTRAAGRSVSFAIDLCVLFATIAMPFVPRFAARVLQCLGLPSPQWPATLSEEALRQVPSGATISQMEVLFAKVTDAELEAWSSRFPPS